MTKTIVGVGLVLGLLAMPAKAGAAPIVAFDFTLAGNQNWTGRLGNFFNVLSPIEVVSLGAFDNPPAGLINGITVGIFDVTANALLFSTVVGPGTPGTLINNTRFVGIGPFLLGVGSYAVVAVGYGQDANYNTNIAPGTPVTIDTGGGLISIPLIRGLYDSNVALGTDLTGVTTGAWTFGGGSFEYQAVPEPGTMVLLGAGLLALGLRARRK